jgi:hypothetical protein
MSRDELSTRLKTTHQTQRKSTIQLLLKIAEALMLIKRIVCSNKGSAISQMEVEKLRCF